MAELLGMLLAHILDPIVIGVALIIAINVVNQSFGKGLAIAAIVALVLTAINSAIDISGRKGVNVLPFIAFMLAYLALALIARAYYRNVSAPDPSPEQEAEVGFIDGTKQNWKIAGIETCLIDTYGLNEKTVHQTLKLIEPDIRYYLSEGIDAEFLAKKIIETHELSLAYINEAERRGDLKTEKAQAAQDLFKENFHRDRINLEERLES